MRTMLATLLLGGVTALSAAALSPKALDYLRELGIDPGSAEVTGIIDDQIGDWTGGDANSLDSLAPWRSERAVRSFIATRNFIRKFQKDTKTPFPSNEVYAARYLKPEELQFIRTALGGKLQPASAAFLRELGFDLESEQVTAILNDQVGKLSDGVPYSLDTLAAVRDKMGVRRFIVTRNFARKFMKDPKTPFPPRDTYEPECLKDDEVDFMLKQQKKP